MIPLPAGALLKWAGPPVGLFAATLLSPEVVVPIAAALIGLLGVWLTVRQTRTEKKADANARAWSSTNQLVDQLQEEAKTARDVAAHAQQRADRLQTEVTALTLRQGMFELGVTILTQQLRANDLEPNWTAPKENA